MATSSNYNLNAGRNMKRLRTIFWMLWFCRTVIAVFLQVKVMIRGA